MLTRLVCTGAALSPRGHWAQAAGGGGGLKDELKLTDLDSKTAEFG